MGQLPATLSFHHSALISHSAHLARQPKHKQLGGVVASKFGTNLHSSAGRCAILSLTTSGGLPLFGGSRAA